MKDRDDKGLSSIGDLLPEIVRRKNNKPLTPIQERLLAPMDAPEDMRDILYQHSVLCQTCMPYRDPGDERICARRNGIVRMEIQAGRALDPRTDDFVDVGLPWGPKARLVLYHLNAEALKQKSRLIEVEDSLTAFVRRTLELDPKGRNIRSVKEQLARLSTRGFSPGSHPRERVLRHAQEHHHRRLRALGSARPQPEDSLANRHPVLAVLLREPHGARRAAQRAGRHGGCRTTPWPSTSTPGSRSGSTA